MREHKLSDIELNLEDQSIGINHFFLEQLMLHRFSGDIEKNYASRLVMATDNSIYQSLPAAVIFPKDTTDIQKIMSLANQERFNEVKFSPRGGGTGTNGQSLTSHLVVDLSRYMTKILEINIEESWVRVQTGIVKDQLNEALKPFGLFFSPDLSTSNRATLGGMINTDASGQGSLIYGKTSDHVLSLQAVFTDGEVFETDGSLGSPKQDTVAFKAYQITKKICEDKRGLILNKFPKLNRFLTGYDLKHTISKTGEFDFSRILCGSEGTLAFITEAKLNLTKIPKFRRLINLTFDGFDSALNCAPKLVEANALSVETLDSTVLHLAQQDIIWQLVKDLIPQDFTQNLLGLNIVEFASDNEEEMDAKVCALTEKLDQSLQNIDDSFKGLIGYQICQDLDEIQKIYTMRKKAVGLLGAVKSNQKPIPFVEDTCVAPENLASFIKEFRQILDSYQLNYGMFGHVDAGVLHVRPALDLINPTEEALIEEISQKVVRLVSKYNGLMWGEHGKGYRSEYVADFFGDTLYHQLRKIKTAFDPKNKMNPGKICPPLTEESADLVKVKVKDQKRAYFDRQIPVKVRSSFTKALDCNGNGLCFNYHPDALMCPSFKVTLDRRYSPKGRASLIREWLRIAEKSDLNILLLEESTLAKKRPFKFILSLFRTPNLDDFSYQVYQSMALCLACKACATQCPVQVDIPHLRSRFLNLFHSYYRRPIKDYLVAYLEFLVPWFDKSPKLINKITNSWPIKTVINNQLGYIDIPMLSTPSLKQLMTPQTINFDINKLRQISNHEKTNYVLILQDCFTSFYESQLVADLILFCQKIGKTPILLPFHANGKAAHVKGFLKLFGQISDKTSLFLEKVYQFGLPIVGIDPAMNLCYQDEYQTNQNTNATFKVFHLHEYLKYIIRQEELTDVRVALNDKWFLFSHCTEKSKQPNVGNCWQEIFYYFSQELEVVPSSCCGMAGSFGHEKQNYEYSAKIYQSSWGEKVKSLDLKRCLATGYSCRSQVKRFEQYQIKHPIQALLKVIR